ncbi:hypothetical protein BDV96DRAFT_690111 [Lophiotrema nucula]|uniref:Uncharacterized protein n=1 Tax=Lophiotrema nucula TaxID=690887 RepID=A0A6A5YY14_9PLEO|nr:hypothetical protein BDV96DRAFT_690111 [Lophiotrema nucula]
MALPTPSASPHERPSFSVSTSSRESSSPATQHDAVSVPQPFPRSAQRQNSNRQSSDSTRSSSDESRTGAMRDVELDSVTRRRRYSIELSKIMGKQLVQGLSTRAPRYIFQESKMPKLSSLLHSTKQQEKQPAPNQAQYDARIQAENQRSAEFYAQQEQSVKDGKNKKKAKKANAMQGLAGILSA